MKTLITTSVFLLLSISLIGQLNVENNFEYLIDEIAAPVSEDIIFTSATLAGCDADRMNGLNDCTKSTLVSYLEEHITYPDVARIYEIEAGCNLSFIITESGHSSDVDVKNCSTDLFGNAVKEAVETLSWKPMLKNGNPTDYKVALNIKFTL